MSMHDMAEQAKQHPGTVGQWVLGIVAGIAAIVIAYSITSMASRLDQLSENQAAIKRDIAWIRAGINDVYTGEEAKEAHDRIFRTDQDQYNRLNGLEARVEVLESKVK